MPIWGAGRVAKVLYVSGFTFRVSEIVKSFFRSMNNAFSMLTVVFTHSLAVSDELEVSSNSQWLKCFLLRYIFGLIPYNCV